MQRQDRASHLTRGPGGLAGVVQRLREDTADALEGLGMIAATGKLALYVTTEGDDATGKRGDSSKPFKTVNGALTQVVTGARVYIGEGKFPPFQVPGLDENGNQYSDLRIIGKGQLYTKIDMTGGTTPGVSFGNGGNFGFMNYVSFEHFAITTDDFPTVAEAIHIDASTWPQFSLILQFLDVYTNGGMTVKYVISVRFVDCDLGGAPVVYQGCGSIVYDHTFGVDMDTTCGNDVSNPLSPNACIIAYQNGTSFDPGFGGTVTATGSMGIDCDASSTCQAFSTAAFPVGAADYYAPYYKVYGHCPSFNIVLPDSAFTTILVDFSGAVVDGNSNTLSVTGSATNRKAALFRGTRFTSTSPTNFGAGIDADARDAITTVSVASAFTTSGTGTIKPPPFWTASQVASTDTTITLPFTLGSTSYGAEFEWDKVATTSFVPGSKTATSLHALSGSVAGSTNIRAHISMY